jgi:adenosylcobinamide kinase/adenosylcobinamide-phosphate guanylyltransferase
MVTVEEPSGLAGALAANTMRRTLVVVDCLTLWLTNLLMPAQGGGGWQPAEAAAATLLQPSPPTPAPSSSSAMKSAWA